MAESSLSLTYDEISVMVARYGLQLDYTDTNWGTQDQADIDNAIDKGYSDFLRRHRPSD